MFQFAVQNPVVYCAFGWRGLLSTKYFCVSVDVWICCMYYLLMWLFCNCASKFPLLDGDQIVCAFFPHFFFVFRINAGYSNYSSEPFCWKCCVFCSSFPCLWLSIAKRLIKCKCGYSISRHEIVKCINMQWNTSNTVTITGLYVGNWRESKIKNSSYVCECLSTTDAQLKNRISKQFPLATQLHERTHWLGLKVSSPCSFISQT